MDAEHAALLREILERLARIEERLTPRRCSPEDRETLAALLLGILGRVGSSPVTSREIVADRALRRVSGDLGVRQLGALLARAARDREPTPSGLIVEALPERRANARVWRVVRVVS